MRLIPVLDLLNGVVVRGVAGQRESYRPVQSQIVDTAEPLDVARAFRKHFGLETLYVADLDAILHNRPNLETYTQLAAAGFAISVDAGIHDIQSAEAILQTGVDSVIAGLESTPAPHFLEELIARCGSSRIVFSLDLKHGQPLSSSPAWDGLSAFQIAQSVLACGVRRMIVLDLAQVGISTGITTLPLCSEIQMLAEDETASKLELITGGGVRDARDLDSLAQAGIDGVLIASAFHNGKLTRDDVEHTNFR
ncbi:MAG: hisF 3 [Planctomycetaceae bacterium]|nr:hisF 3 [Planctomycetaceae bacterium]